MTFHIENGGQVDPLEFTKQMINLHPDVKIYIGCDSQDKKRECWYATVIAYRFTYGEEGIRKGARYIYLRETVEKTKDKFTRLWGEVERSVDLALWLREQGVEVSVIDLDFNHKDTTGSYDMVASGSGYVKGFGFESTCKPEEQIASRAADHIVKKKSGRSRRFHFKKKRKVA